MHLMNVILIMMNVRGTNINVLERIFALILLIFIVAKGKDVNIYVIYGLLIIAMAIALRRFIINRREGKSNQRFYLALVFMILSLAMTLFV